MRIIWAILITSCALALTVPADASEAGVKVIEAARAECGSLENGVLEVDDRAISSVDVTGDGKLNEIIDSSRFACTSAASLFCGTGGCAISVIVDGIATQFLAKGWKVVSWDDQPILILAVHGSECGGNNLRRCYRALVWSEGGFRAAGQ